MITDLDDGDFSIEVGLLQCFLYPDSDGSVLDFVPWVVDHPVPGMVRGRRMLPTETLRRKLAEVGFPTEFGGHPGYPSLVARMPRLFTPHEVAEKLQQILRGGDSTLLYYDPAPEQAKAELHKLLATQT